MVGFAVRFVWLPAANSSTTVNVYPSIDYASAPTSWKAEIRSPLVGNDAVGYVHPHQDRENEPL